jgi:hypothetical protein
MARKLLIAFSLLLIIPVVIAQGAEERECCPSRAGGIGIGAWFHHEMICASLRHWPTETRALELDFCAPPGGARLSLFIKGLNKLSDGCILDLYMTGGLGLPVGGAIDWQRLEGSFGTEWCFLDLPQMTIGLEVGASITHYLYCAWWGCEWRWGSETFIAGGVHFYFRTP